VELQVTPVSNLLAGVPRGTPVKTGTDSSASALFFETEEEIQAVPIEIKRIIGFSNYRYTDVAEFNHCPGAFYHAFGKEAGGGEAFYLGLDVGISTGDLAGKELRLAVYPYEADLPPEGEGLPGEEALELFAGVSPLARVAWEYWDGSKDSGWKTLDVTASAETAAALSGKGFLSVVFNDVITKGTPVEFPQYLQITDGLLWVRCKLLESFFEIPPRLDRILPNVVSAVEGKTAEETWESSGLPCQVFKTRGSPVAAGSQKVIIREDREWEAVPDFDASGPGDMHYVIKPVTGEICFGNGLNGAVPVRGKTITVRYRVGGGGRGNVAAGVVNRCTVPGITVVNPYPGHGGEDAETIDGVFHRFKKELDVPYTAVTVQDYEYIARRTPGLRVARARALYSKETGKVTVVVIPYSFEEKPLAGNRFKQIVSRYLDKHRLVTTVVEISDPVYVRVSVTAAVRVKSGYDPVRVKAGICKALDRFLSPLKREGGDNEWPFGRPVYSSEVSEVLEGEAGVDCVDSLSFSASGGTVTPGEMKIEIGFFGLVYPGPHEIEIIGTNY
jgi:predicted phage baseplate assembly protein